MHSERPWVRAALFQRVRTRNKMAGRTHRGRRGDDTLTNIEEIRNRKIGEIVALDVGSTSVKAVKVRRNGSSYALLETEVLEAVDLAGATAPRLELDKKLQSPYAAICYSGRNTQVRYLDMPAKTPPGAATEARVRKLMGVGPDFRVGATIARPGRSGDETRMLAVAAPTEEANRLRKLFPDNKPNLISLEVSGLAALHAFERCEKARRQDAAVAYIEAGNQVTILSFFVKGELALVRKFEFGSRDLIERVKSLLATDDDTALGVLYDDPTPLESAAEAPMNTFLKQVTVSKQFVEKEENLRVGAIYTSGGLSYSPYWMSQIREALGAEIDIWNPFTENGITSYPRGVKGVESMFAPALGAALAILNPS